MNCKSEIQNPCDFFVCFVSIEQIEKFYESYRESYIGIPHFNSEDDTVYEWEFNQETKEFSDIRVVSLVSLFILKLNSILGLEVENSIRLIENFNIENEGNKAKFKTYIDTKVKNKLSNLYSSQIAKEYPCIYNHINSLIERVNNLDSNIVIDKIQIEDEENDPSTNPLTISEKIDAIFSFTYKVKSIQYNQPFITIEDYEKFKTAIIRFLEGNDYFLENKVEFKGLGNNELNYLFYLIKKINGIRPKLTAKNWFVFAHNVLSNYSDKGQETFEGKLKSKLSLNEHPYLPQFVKSYYLRS